MSDTLPALDYLDLGLRTLAFLAVAGALLFVERVVSRFFARLATARMIERERELAAARVAAREAREARAAAPRPHSSPLRRRFSLVR